MPKIWKVDWTEHERGWGQRPDGHTLHFSRELADAYIRRYWAQMPKEAPDDYSRPSNPYAIEVSDYEAGVVMEANNMWGHVRSWSHTPMVRPEPTVASYDSIYTKRSDDPRPGDSVF